MTPEAQLAELSRGAVDVVEGLAAVHLRRDVAHHQLDAGEDLLGVLRRRAAQLQDVG